MKAILFDLDGTLADTLEDIRAALNQALVGTGARAVDSEECRSVVGRGLRNAIRGAMRFSSITPPDCEVEEIYSRLSVYYAAHPCEFTEVYPGVHELLHSLRRKGILLGVLSNKSDELVIEIISKLFPEGLFTYVHGLRDGFPAKPDPAGVLEFCSFSGLNPEDVIFIGDSEVDYETIMNTSGMSGVIVTWGFRSRSSLMEAGAHPLADDIHQLEVILNEA